MNRVGNLANDKEKMQKEIICLISFTEENDHMADKKISTIKRFEEIENEEYSDFRNRVENWIMADRRITSSQIQNLTIICEGDWN